MRRVLAALSIVLGAMLAAPAGATPTVPSAPRLDSHIDVAVMVEGSLPGFTADELTAYVIQQMNSAHVAAWSFTPATTQMPANRVVWRFRQLPYAGGSVRYIGPLRSGVRELFGARRAIGIDARVFIDGQFESTTFDQASIKGGPKDADLADVVRRVAKSVVANVVAQHFFNRSDADPGEARAAMLAPSKTAPSETNRRS